MATGRCAASSLVSLLASSPSYCDRKKGKEKEEEGAHFRRVKRVQCSCRPPVLMKLSKKRQTVTVAAAAVATEQKVSVKRSSALRSAVFTLIVCAQLVTLTGASRNHPPGGASDTESLVVNTLNGPVLGRTVSASTGKQVHFLCISYFIFHTFYSNSQKPEIIW